MIGSSNGFTPNRLKPIPEPTMTKFTNAYESPGLNNESTQEWKFADDCFKCIFRQQNLIFFLYTFLLLSLSLPLSLCLLFIVYCCRCCYYYHYHYCYHYHYDYCCHHYHYRYYYSFVIHLYSFLLFLSYYVLKHLLNARQITSVAENLTLFTPWHASYDRT